jgi:hypothetical protein
MVSVSVVFEIGVHVNPLFNSGSALGFFRFGKAVSFFGFSRYCNVE